MSKEMCSAPLLPASCLLPPACHHQPSTSILLPPQPPASFSFSCILHSASRLLVPSLCLLPPAFYLQPTASFLRPPDILPPAILSPASRLFPPASFLLPPA